MLQSSADNASRSVKPEERLFPLWKLIGLGISALVVLGMLYGNQRILQQVANVEYPDNISLFFLRNIQREHPQDESWRILLAQQQLELGELSDAQKTVQPLLNSRDPVLQKNAGLIDLQIMEMQMLVGRDNDQEKRDLQSTMTARIRELLLHSMTQKDLSSLADSALLAEDWQLATQVYRQLAQADPNNQAAWFRKGAKLALGQGAYTQAAELFFFARTQSHSFEDKREDYLSALKALIAGNQLQEALVQAEKYLGNLEQDDATLKFLVRLGRAAGNGAFAQKYVEKLLHVSRGRSGKIFATFSSKHLH
ncbi:MAG: hypothetical protein OET79_11455, partial [Nitrospirota bacterium]|nr:hypothetical protein [Nitrospirota bacterium]